MMSTPRRSTCRPFAIAVGLLLLAAGAGCSQRAAPDDVRYQRAHDARRERARQISRGSAGNAEASIPHSALVTFPDQPAHTAAHTGASQ